MAMCETEKSSPQFKIKSIWIQYYNHYSHDARENLHVFADHKVQKFVDLFFIYKN